MPVPQNMLEETPCGTWAEQCQWQQEGVGAPCAQPPFLPRLKGAQGLRGVYSAAEGVQE